VNPRDVFINCPFSPDYRDHFRAIVYTVVRSGFTPRCARERDDAGEVRYEKICRIIKDCAYGIHDISMTELDADTGLPRFNMPFELGLFLGATRFGARSFRSKATLVLDRDAWRFREFLSDISGQDPHAHEGKIPLLIERIATWLRDQGGDPRIPGGRAIAAEFERLSADLPAICAARGIEPDELTFLDYWNLAAEWIVAEIG